MKESRLERLYETLCEEAPPCVMCEFKCPYSPYKNGLYCELDNPFHEECYTIFKKWLEGENLKST